MKDILEKIEKIKLKSESKEELLNGLLSVISENIDCIDSNKLRIESFYTDVNKLIDLEDALEEYADPGFYHAVAFLFDSPCGNFQKDFSDDHGDLDYDGARAGRLARRALYKTRYRDDEIRQKHYDEMDNTESLMIMIKYQYLIAQIRYFRPELTESHLATKIDKMSKDLNQSVKDSLLDCMGKAIDDEPMHWEIKNISS